MVAAKFGEPLKKFVKRKNRQRILGGSVTGEEYLEKGIVGDKKRGKEKFERALASFN